MKDCLLLTTVHGTPILIGDAGLTIEPEPHAHDRKPGSIVVLPNGNRERPKIIVQQDFTDICKALSRAGHLIEVTPDEPKTEPIIVEPEPSYTNIAEALRMDDDGSIDVGIDVVLREDSIYNAPEKKPRARAKKVARP
jgi:hypothetical protein